VVNKQIEFMKNQPLGFSNEQKLVFELNDWGTMNKNYTAIKDEFRSNPSILAASVSSGVPGSFINRTWIFPENEEKEKGQAFRSLRCDQEFIDTYNIELVAGRSFNLDNPGDILQTVIINEAGVEAFGWNSPEEAVGKYLGGHREIIGVTKNFHWWGLQHQIEPMLMRVVPDLFRSVTLTVDTKNMKETISFVGERYSKLFPESIFDYYFVDENFSRQYQYEEKIFAIFIVFTILGLFVACLGLIGLSSFIAEQRTREIAIRKVYGATIQNIYMLLSGEFVMWVLAGSLIAVPLVYLIGTSWLETFAYSFDFDWRISAIALVAVTVISGITISFQIFKASTKNGVRALNYS
jgi:putative ABC transport system permease protein